MKRLTQQQIKAIAQEIYKAGHIRAEAFPIRSWRNRGWPEESIVFKLVDAHLVWLRLLDEYRE